MNTRVPPFDDPLVREAVNYGIDKPALARLFAGELAPGCTFLPPGCPGYDEAFDTTECPYGDPTQPPDLAKAQDLIKQAGAEGDQGHRLRQQRRPDRQGDAGVRGHAEPDRPRRRGRRSSTAASTSRRSATRRRRPRPGSPTGSRISRTRSTSISWLTGTRSSRRTTRTSATSTTRRSTTRSTALEPARPTRGGADDWAELDRVLVEPPQSYVAPYGHRKLSKFFSERMDFDERGVPPGVLQRLLDVGAEGRRVEHDGERGANRRPSLRLTAWRRDNRGPVGT